MTLLKFSPSRKAKLPPVHSIMSPQPALSLSCPQWGWANGLFEISLWLG